MLVSTRVPSNIFTYDLDQSIDILGTVNMKLAGSRRRLQAIDIAKVDETEEGTINLKVYLQDDSFPKEVTLFDNSALDGGKIEVVVTLSMMLVSLHTIW